LIANNPLHSKLVLGIDTGGTYTDGILMDYGSRRVLATHKCLTTKRDLSLGIEAVIEGIRIENPAAIRLVSVSTTLATNAIAEGKGQRVALLLIGYDPELIATFKMAARFGTAHYYFFSGGHDLHGREKTPLDLPAILERVAAIRAQVDAIAVSAYFSPLNPEHEQRCFKAIKGICDHPVVLGHQLSTRLGSVERATTAALNAALLAMLKAFIVAVKRVMDRRRIAAPLMVVRGDGTLMSDAFAADTPVETIHSGPAASAIGARALSGRDDALVIDIGGTTTDIALIERGRVAVREDGATVAGFKTMVKAADLCSIALGGDSHIHLGREHELIIGPERMVPIACLADGHPDILPGLQALARRRGASPEPESVEYWYLLREPLGAAAPTTAPEKALVAFLTPGPRALPEILAHLGLFSRVQIETAHLDRHEVIGRAALTPTDLLHVDGSYTAWNTDAARYALKVVARGRRCAPEVLANQIRTMITETIVQAIVCFLTGLHLPPLSAAAAASDFGPWFLRNSLRADHPHLRTRLELRPPLIGIGAPAKNYLGAVADSLHTELILPDHYQVANAVGAVAGSIMVTEELIVYPRVAADGRDPSGYYVQTQEARRLCDGLQDALAVARDLSRERALGAALRSGADSPQLTVETHQDGLDTFRIKATALGNPRLARGAGLDAPSSGSGSRRPPHQAPDDRGGHDRRDSAWI
jgi:N-methylhydantoinase A/oxoprolinase/acetone carboxylase beta subunit